LRRPHRGSGRSLESLAQNHPFIDDNKRTDFAVTYTFLAINGARITADAEAAYAFIARLYETNEFTFEKLAAWLRDNVVAAA
jgi:death on curing protein